MKAPHRSPLAALVTALTLVTFELVRASGPLLDLAFARGTGLAATAAIVTYLLPGPFAALLVLAARRRPVGTLLLAGSATLAVARLAVQFTIGPARFWVGLATVALALAVLTLAVAALAGRPGGGRRAATAVVQGAAGAVGLQLALGTWDAIWRPGLAGWLVALALASALIWLGRAARALEQAPSARPSRLWVLGPVLGLSAMSLANPAFAASQSGLPLALAGTVTAGGLLLAAACADRIPTTGPLPGFAAVAFPAALALIYLVEVPGVVLLALLVAAQTAAAVVLATVLGPREGAFRAGRAAAAASAVGLATIAPVLVFQLDYDVPLGFDNGLVPVAVAALVGLAALGRVPAPPEVSSAEVAPAEAPEDPARRSGPSGAVSAVTLAVAGALVAAGGALTTHLGSQQADDPGPAGRVALVSWNLHYGVGPDGEVDLETIARTIAEQDACVVLLQEVSRGWVLGGGADMATWLSNRLGMRMEFAPAADGQFGNAILSCTPAADVVVHDLPYGAGPQNRSALSADITLGGVTERYTTVHLQHREENTPTRLDQLAALTSAGTIGILGGDLNAEPGWEEIAFLEEQGWVSTQDAVGDPAALTSPADDPRYRIDWVFVPERLRDALVDLTVLDTDASDHRPLVLRLEVD